MAGFGESIIGAAGSALGSGGIGMGLNFIGGLINSRKEKKQREWQEQMMQKQFENEKEKMGLQAQYNKEQAAYNQDLAKDMYTYTGMGSQIQQMKNEGLNPALMYSGGAGGGNGSTAGAGQAQGVQQGTSDAVGMAIRAKEVSQNERLVESEITKNLAEAGKVAGAESFNLTEGGKKYGTGQEVDKSTIELQETLSQLNTATARLRESDIEVNQMTKEEKAAHVKLYGDMSQKVWQEARAVAVKADIAEETKEQLIKQTYAETTKMYLGNLEKLANIKLTEQQTEYIETQRAGFWYQCYTGRISAEAQAKRAESYADEVTGRIENWKGTLSLDQKRFVKECVLESVNALIKAGDVIGDFLPTKMWKQMTREQWSKDKNGDWKMDGYDRTNDKTKSWK